MCLKLVCLDVICLLLNFVCMVCMFVGLDACVKVYSLDVSKDACCKCACVASDDVGG